jgi:phosphohistidine phosphatase
MSLVYVMRHGQAESGAGRSDETRRLTPEGAAGVQRAAQGLARMGVQLDRILASPLVRTQQTAELVADVLTPGATVVTSQALSPFGSARAALEEVLDVHPDVERLLLVGHLPDVSTLVGLMVLGEARGSFCFLPGSLACVEFAGGRQPGRGQLRWLLTCEQLQASR